MKSVLITGANRGIGLEFTRWYLSHKYDVIATTRSLEKAEQLKALQREVGNQLKIIELDVSSDKVLTELPQKLKDIPHLDLLINNAGTLVNSNEKNTTAALIENIRETFEVNSLGAVRTTFAVLPLLKKSSHPRVAHLTSLMGSIADNTSGGYYAYRMSKAALNMFNKSFSVDEPAITAVVLHPGWVKTDMGGAQAPLEPHRSVEGLTKVIEDLKPSDSGKFFEYTGRELPW